MEIKFPHKRNELILLLTDLCRLPLGLPKAAPNFIGGIQPYFDFFCLDNDFRLTARNEVGFVFLNEAEADATARVAALLAKIIDKYGYYTSHTSYLKDPQIRELARAAQDAKEKMAQIG
jgi:hypothetical protein